MSKVALVTGGAKRIGANICKHLAGNGWEVIIHCNTSEKEAIALSNQLKERYPNKRFPVVKFNLENWKEVDNLWEQVLSLNLLPSLLINNASVFVEGKLEETDSSLMDQMLAVNMLAPIQLSRLFKCSANGGVIINILDSAIKTNSTNHAAYLLAKKGLHQFTQMAAKEWADQIRVNAIAPGPVLPPPGKENEYLREVIERTPLKKQVSSQSINASIDYLLVNENVTGETLFCDSGQHLL